MSRRPSRQPSRRPVRSRKARGGARAVGTPRRRAPSGPGVGTTPEAARAGWGPTGARLDEKARSGRERTPDVVGQLRAWLREHPVPPRPSRRPTAEDWERLGYRVTEMGDSGRILEPLEPTFADRYHALKRELTERLWRQGIPSPVEYAEWYRTRAVADLERASLPEVLHCDACGKPLEAKNGAFLVPDFKMLRAKRPLQRFCSARCRRRRQQYEYRQRHPEQKLRRSSPVSRSDYPTQ